MILDVLDDHAAGRSSERPAFSYVAAEHVTSLTYCELREGINDFARCLPPAAGDILLIRADDPLSMIVAFLGSLAARATPVVVGDYASASPSRLEQRVADARRVLPGRLLHVKATREQANRAVVPSIIERLEPPTRSSDVAASHAGLFTLQLTSGSTGDPAAIPLTQDGVVQAAMAQNEWYSATRRDVAVNWTPLAFDMGMMVNLVRPLVGGYHSVLLGALDYMARPLLLLDVMTATRGTLTSAPPFGYERLLSKVPSDAGTPRWDLSPLRVARVAADTVAPSLIHRLNGLAASQGAPRPVACPSYGLAEATLTVTGVQPGYRPFILHAAAIPAPGAAVEVSGCRSPDCDHLKLVSNGPAISGLDVRIAGTTDDVMYSERTVGEVVIAGRSVCHEYYGGRAARQARIDETTFLRTGDIGFTHDGELYLCGRSRDMIICRGVNIFACDVEAVDLDTTTHSIGETCAVLDRSREVYDIYLESDASEVTLPALVSAVRRTLASRLGVQPRDIFVLPRRAMPRTSSGKLRREAMRANVTKAVAVSRYRDSSSRHGD